MRSDRALSEKVIMAIALTLACAMLAGFKIPTVQGVLASKANIPDLKEKIAVKTESSGSCPSKNQETIKYVDELVTKDEDWDDIKKLMESLQSAVAKRNKHLVNVIAQAIAVATAKQNNVFVAYDYESGKFKAGLSKQIVQPSIEVRAALHRRSEDQPRLDTEIKGVGSIYTGEDLEVDGVNTWKSYDIRMPNYLGGEIFTKNGKVKTSKTFIGGIAGKRLMYELKEDMKNHEHNGFVHVPTNKLSLKTAGEFHDVKMVVADYDSVSKMFLVRATLESEGKVWRITSGDINRCEKCLTRELKSLLIDLKVIEQA